MKLATKILSLLVMVGLATFYTGCDKNGGEDKTQEENQLIKLNNSWALESAHDGISARTTDFPNLVLTLSGTYVKNGTYNYSFTGTRPNPSPWPVNGTWKFGTNIPSDLIRDPGTPNETPMEYTLSGDKLTVKFNVAEGSAGWAGGTSRVQKVSGEWTFVFNKQ